MKTYECDIAVIAGGLQDWRQQLRLLARCQCYSVGEVKHNRRCCEHGYGTSGSRNRYPAPKHDWHYKGRSLP